MNGNELLETIAGNFLISEQPVCLIYSAMVESVRNLISMFCTARNDSEIVLESKVADIKSIIYMLRKQYGSIIQDLDFNIKKYFFNQERTINPFIYIIKQMFEAGEIINLTHGKYTISPYKTIDIGIPDKVIMQGGITLSDWIGQGKCELNGVTRIINKSILNTSITYMSYSLDTWLLLPYKGDKLVEWTKSVLYRANFSRAFIDTNLHIYNPCIKSNLQMDKWISIGDLGQHRLDYTIGRSRGIDGYSYWILRNVSNGKYDGIASLEKYFVVRLIYGLDAIYNCFTNVYYSLNENSLFLHFPNRIPLDEMRIIKATSYPWPYIDKNSFYWMINKELWNVIKPIFMNLKVNILEARSKYTLID